MYKEQVYIYTYLYQYIQILCIQQMHNLTQKDCLKPYVTKCDNTQTSATENH